MPKDRKKKENTRHIKKRLFIICEGKETEFNYFNKLVYAKSRRGCPICIKVVQGKSPTPDRLIKQANLCKKEVKTDEAWVVFDKDNFDKHEDAFEKAKKNKIQIAFSSISFEYWVLLHFEYTAKAFANSNSLIKEIKKHIKFKKNDTELYKKIRAHTTTAKTNAQKIRESQKQSNQEKEIYEMNPYTNVDELLEAIDRIIKEYQ